MKRRIINTELSSLQEFSDFVENLTLEEIERDLSKIVSEIKFQIKQTELELDSYTTQQLEEIDSDMFLMERKRDILKYEFERRVELTKFRSLGSS